MKNQRLLAAGGVALVLFVSGCGSDGDETLSAQEFRTQANTVCSLGEPEINQAVSAVFSQGEPTPDAMQAALDTIVSSTRRQIDEIDALRPPKDLENDVTAMLAELRSATNHAEGQGLGFWDNDGNPWAEASKMARSLGLDVCGAEG